MEAAEAIDWTRRRPGRSTPAARRSTAGSPTPWSTPAGTPSTATSRPATATGVAIIYDSPVTGSKATITYAELRDRVARAGRRAGGARRRQGRPGHHLHADGARGAGGDAGLRPARGDPLGGVRRLRRARARGADRRRRRRRRSSPPPAASSPAGWSPTSRWSTPRSSMARAQARLLHRSSSAPQARGRADRRRATSTGTRRRRAWRRRPACRSAAWIRSTSSTPPAPPAQPKGVVRANGGHMVALAWTMRNIYAIAPGEVFWAASDVGWVVGHSYICYAPLLVGRDHHRLRGQAGRHARRRHLLAGDRGAPGRAASSPRRRPSARSSARTRRASWSTRLRPDRRLRYLFLAGERADPDTIVWAQTAPEGAGDRPLVADRDRLGDRRRTRRGSSSCRSSSARRRCRCPATTCRSCRRPATPLPPGELGAVAIRLPLPPGTLPTLWNADEPVREVLPRHLPRLLRDRRRRA